MAARCGGAAWILASASRALGLNAWTVNFGRPSLYTHVVTVVKAEGHWILEDPMFGGSFRGARGVPLDLPTALRRMGHPGRGLVQTPLSLSAATRLIRDQDLAQIITPWKRAQRAALLSRPVRCRPGGPGMNLCVGVAFGIELDVAAPLRRSVFRYLAARGRAHTLYALMLDPIGITAPGIGRAPTSSDHASIADAIARAQ